MSEGYIGNCPDLVTGFDITLEIPQMVESPTAQNIVAETRSPISNISRGLWSVSFIREAHPWDGTPHVHPIYDQAFAAGVTNDASIDAGTGWVYTRVNWPCNLLVDSLFTQDLTPFNPGEQALAGSGLRCNSVFLFDLGCPNCQGLVAVTLGVIAGTEWANANAYAFSVRAVGTRIG